MKVDQGGVKWWPYKAIMAMGGVDFDGYYKCGDIVHCTKFQFTVHVLAPSSDKLGW